MNEYLKFRLDFPISISPAFCFLLEVQYGRTKKVFSWQSERRSFVSYSLQPHGLNSPGQNTGIGSLSLLQGIFPTQGSNPGLPHCRRILYHLSHQGSFLDKLDFKFYKGKDHAYCTHCLAYTQRLRLLGHVWLFEMSWTIAYQASLSMDSSRQEYCIGLPFPSPGDLPKPGIEPRSSHITGIFLTIWAIREALHRD